jgi:CRP-like cAMP-binding protein
MPFRRKKIDDAAERLSKIAFFEEFTPAELARVGTLIEEVSAEEGAVLTEQGKPGQECYVIAEGEAKVEVGGEQIAVVGPGTMIGEMALIDNRPRSATIRALKPMKLLALDTKHFKTMLEEMPSANKAVMSRLTDLLRTNDLS